MLKKEDPDKDPSPEKILKVRNRLNDFLRTIKGLKGLGDILDEPGLRNFRKGAKYIDAFINGAYAQNGTSERRNAIYFLDAFFDLVEEKTKEFALRNTLSTDFQELKSKLYPEKPQNNPLENPTAYLIWSQLSPKEERFDATVMSSIPGSAISNAIDSLIQGIKDEGLQLEGLDKMQQIAASKAFEEYSGKLNTPWTIANYNETFAEKVGPNLVVSKYWSKFLPHLVFYLHNLVNAGGTSMAPAHFPGARCATGTKADLLINAGRMLTGKMDANIDFGDSK